MRQDGKPDIRLGTDHSAALKQWDELHNKKPRIVGRLQEAFDRWREAELPRYDSDVTRRNYAQNLTRIEPVFGQMAWDAITLPMLREYLDRRSAKTQGNRELALMSVIWGKALLWGMTRCVWPAAGVKNWKNKESARTFEVTDALFGAVYAEADQVLRDCMDIATATGMRLTDTRTIRMPADDIIRHKPSKTGKSVEFEVSASPVLAALVARRDAMKAYCVMLLCTDTGRQVTQTMLRYRWDTARDKAALKASQTGNPDFAKDIRAMYLRDMRSRAADLAGNMADASKLLQHSNQALTAKHYRNKAEKLTAVR
ncbi:MAG: integrase [Rhodoferax sp.]|nr:integrase [Rhodoferax sp.]